MSRISGAAGGIPPLPVSGGISEVSISGSAAIFRPKKVFRDASGAMRQSIINSTYGILASRKRGELDARGGSIDILFADKTVKISDDGCGIPMEKFEDELRVMGRCTNTDTTLPASFGLGHFSHPLMGGVVTIDTRTADGSGFVISCRDGAVYKQLAREPRRTRGTTITYGRLAGDNQISKAAAEAAFMAQGCPARVSISSRRGPGARRGTGRARTETTIYPYRTPGDYAEAWRRGGHNPVFERGDGFEFVTMPGTSFNFRDIITVAGVRMWCGLSAEFPLIISIDDEAGYPPALGRAWITHRGAERLSELLEGYMEPLMRRSAGIRTYAQYRAFPHPELARYAIDYAEKFEGMGLGRGLPLMTRHDLQLGVFRLDGAPGPSSLMQVMAATQRMRLAYVDEPGPKPLYADGDGNLLYVTSPDPGPESAIPTMIARKWRLGGIPRGYGPTETMFSMRLHGTAETDTMGLPIFREE